MEGCQGGPRPVEGSARGLGSSWGGRSPGPAQDGVLSKDAGGGGGRMWDPEPSRGPASGPCGSHGVSCPQKLTVDLTGVLGVLQSQQQRLLPGGDSASCSRLCNLYWQAMKALGVQ